MSVVVPVRNEAANILPLVAEITAACTAAEYEIIYVDDGSTDGTPAVLAEAEAQRAGRLLYLRHRVSCGQSAAIMTGVRHARGVWIATLDGDGQNDPADLMRLLDRAVAAERQGGRMVLVAGHRIRRADRWSKRIGSKIANRVRAAILRDDTPDTGCGLKVFRRAAFAELPHFDHMHRFLPALFRRAGGRVISVPVLHRPRLCGRSNYGNFDRLWVGIIDMLGVYWLQRRWNHPEIISRNASE